MASQLAKSREYGEAGTIGGTDRENREVRMLALHLLQDLGRAA